jgi:hypothetical protein
MRAPQESAHCFFRVSMRPDASSGRNDRWHAGEWVVSQGGSQDRRCRSSDVRNGEAADAAPAPGRHGDRSGTARVRCGHRAVPGSAGRSICRCRSARSDRGGASGRPGECRKGRSPYWWRAMPSGVMSGVHRRDCPARIVQHSRRDAQAPIGRILPSRPYPDWSRQAVHLRHTLAGGPVPSSPHRHPPGAPEIAFGRPPHADGDRQWTPNHKVTGAPVCVRLNDEFRCFGASGAGRSC